MSRGSEKPRKRGRPKALPGTTKRAAFNTRIRDQVKLALEKSAAASGRSLSEEIEARLEQSLRTEDSVFGGAEKLSLFKMLAAAAHLVELSADGRSIFKDEATFLQFRGATLAILDHFRPKDGSPSPRLRPGWDSPAQLEALGALVGKLVIAPSLVYPPGKLGLDPDDPAALDHLPAPLGGWLGSTPTKRKKD